MVRFSSGVLFLATLMQVSPAQEAKLASAQVPSVVSSAATQRFPQAKLGSWSKETEDGKTTFEVSIVDGTGKRDAVFAPDGALVCIETSMRISAIPASVKKAILVKYPHARISKAEKITLADNELQFEVELLKAAKKELLLSVDGRILKEE